MKKWLEKLKAFYVSENFMIVQLLIAMFLAYLILG